MRRLVFRSTRTYRLLKILSRRLANDVEEYRSKQLIALLDDVVRVEILRLPVRSGNSTPWRARPALRSRTSFPCACAPVSHRARRRTSIHHRRRVVTPSLASRRVDASRVDRASTLERAKSDRTTRARKTHTSRRDALTQTFERERARVRAPAGGSTRARRGEATRACARHPLDTPGSVCVTSRDSTRSP